MVTTTRTRRFTADEYERMAALGIPAHDAYRFTIDEYERLAEAGLFTGKGRVELIEGEIIEMAAMGGPHIRCVAWLVEILRASVPRDLFVNPQCAIRLDNGSEPEPDFAVVRDWDFENAVPAAAEVLLMIEVADATLRADRRDKLPLYARAGIPEAWLMDVKAKTVERHTDPRDGQYGEKVVAVVGESLASTVVPGVVIPVADVFR